MDFLDFVRKTHRERKRYPFIQKGGPGSGWFGPPKGTHVGRTKGAGWERWQKRLALAAEGGSKAREASKKTSRGTRGAARVMYEPTKNQERKWAEFGNVAMPTDEEFRERWAKAHHGSIRGWGMGKRNFVLNNMTRTRGYQTGIWQGRVDAARGLKYSEERNENIYNLGYYRGYTNYKSDRRGWDRNTRQRFDEKYVNGET